MLNINSNLFLAGFVYSGSESYYTPDVHQPLSWNSSSSNPSLVSHEAQQTRHKMSITQIVQNWTKSGLPL